MAYARNTYPNVNGTQETFQVTFGYLYKTDVSVTINDVPTIFTWDNDTTVRVTPAPAAGATVAVVRTTDASAPAINFTDGANLSEAELDAQAEQSIYIAQEVADRVEALEGNPLQSPPVSFIPPAATVTYAASAPGSPSTNDCWVDTGDNYKAYYWNGSWIAAFTQIAGSLTSPGSIIANALSGNTVAATTITGTTAAMTGDISGATGTFSGAVEASMVLMPDNSSSPRVEAGDDGTYVLWAGSGGKNDTNATIYIKNNGDAHLSGDLSVDGAITGSISADSILGALTLSEAIALTETTVVTGTNGNPVPKDIWHTVLTFNIASAPAARSFWFSGMTLFEGLDQPSTDFDGIWLDARVYSPTTGFTEAKGQFEWGSNSGITGADRDGQAPWRFDWTIVTPDTIVPVPANTATVIQVQLYRTDPFNRHATFDFSKAIGYYEGILRYKLWNTGGGVITVT